MGVSKIVREIEGKVGDEWGCGRGELGERIGLSGVKGLVNWGVFGKWMGMGGKFKKGGLRGEGGVDDVWFVELPILSCCANSGCLLEIYPYAKLPYKCSYIVLYDNR